MHDSVTYDDEVDAQIRADEERERYQAHIHEWRKLNTQRYGRRTAQRAALHEKDMVPPEFLRKVVKDNGDLSGRRFKSERKLCVGLLPYMPLALYKLLECMPMPWEEARYVHVVYHIHGLLTLVADTPTVAEPLYLSQWGSMWTTMRAHKVELSEEGACFRRVVHKADANEPPLDFADYLMDRDPPPALRDELLAEEEEEDEEGAGRVRLSEWMYEHAPQPSAPNEVAGTRHPRGYYFTPRVLEALHRHAVPLLPRLDDPNYRYLWNLPALYSAKAMHVAIPRGPKFEPSPAMRARMRAMGADGGEEDWTEFNDLRRVIHRDDPRKPRFTMLTERQIAFPFLYSAVVEGVRLAPYAYSPVVRVENEDPDIPCFAFHSSLNPMKAVERLATPADYERSMLCSTALRAGRVCGGHDNDTEATAPGITTRGAVVKRSWYINDEDDNNDAAAPRDEDILAAAMAESPMQPFLSSLPLEAELTKSAMTLLSAAKPFRSFDGGMKRRVDVRLCDDAYQEPPGLQPSSDDRDKILRSYTQLLKHHVKRSLRGEQRRHCRRRRQQQQRRAAGRRRGGRRGGYDDESGESDSESESSSSDGEAAEEEETDVRRRLDRLSQMRYFARTQMDWLEAALQLMRQGHNMLVQLIHMKCLPYVHMDYNFEAKPTRTLTTKEIKKSRLGPSFHLIRELLGFVKRLVDLHVMYRLGRSSAAQLADATHYLFNHVGVLTGVYRYKLRAMRQIRRARDWKHVLYSRFNVGGVVRGPGCGFWGPAWRVWVFFFRGMTPLMQRYLTSLTDRVLRGRVQKGPHEGKRITRQRVETDKDVNIKEAYRRELKEMLPENVKPGVIVTMDQHMNEAFRHWRAGLPWSVVGLARPLEQLVRKYVKLRSEEYIRTTQLQRQRIASGDTVDKQAFMKNLGRLTRLKMMEEQQRQGRYVTSRRPEEEEASGSGSSSASILSAEEGAEMYRVMANWLSDRGFQKIGFPDPAKTAELSLLQLSLNRLREQHNIANRMTATQREEQARIEEAFNAPHEALSRIVDALARQRRFKQVEVEYMDNFSHLYPIYNVCPAEKMVDAFLDQYLWYKAMNLQRLFPSWVKPADVEPAPLLVHRWCDGINNSPDIWDVSKEESVVLLHRNLGEAFYDKVDWNVFRHLLELIMDKSLVDYVVSRHDVVLEFKDMSYHHHVGLLRGYMFSSFLAQYWGLMMDILLLGTQRSQELAGTATRPNPFMRFMQDPFLATAHPIRGYCRYRHEVYILLRYTKSEADALRRRYLEETKHDPVLRAMNASVYGFVSATQPWPRDARMRLFLADVNLARAVRWEFRGRLPPAIAPDTEDEHHMAYAAHASSRRQGGVPSPQPGAGTSTDGFVSVYSKDNPNLLFDMAGFAVRLLPVHRTETAVLESESMWSLRHHTRKDVTCRAFLQVTREHVELIRNKARRTVMMVGSSAFHSIAAKWNALVTEVVPYYREAILGSTELQAILARAEHRMQARVMMALQSRAKSRFPPAMFYAPSDFGGLGMLSVGHSFIPARDVTYSRTTSTGVQYFYAGLTNSEGVAVPNVLSYYTPWQTEFRESDLAWQEFRRRERAARAQGGSARVSLEEMEDILDKGIPRIRVRFSRHAPLFHFDVGFRCRLEFQRYQAGRYVKNWWFHPEHDGNVNGGVLERYRSDVNIALGGVEAILEHSLFKGTGFPSWEGIEFNRSGGFEHSKKDAKLAKQQRAGLTKVPNQRFALWWSPTINRADVQAGFESKIDTTGVFMCGKLETIKKSLIKIFSGSLWEKCHGAIVHDVASKLKDTALNWGAATVTLQQQHPQKSYTLTSSAADIIVVSAARWPVSARPTALHEGGVTSSSSASSLVSRPGAGGATHEGEEEEPMGPHTTAKFWIDVQLRWGNFDSHNIAEYARKKFYEYSSAKMYPFPAGIVIAFDLAYNCHSAFGYWIPSLKAMMQKLLSAIARSNITLNTLRDRMKRDLGLFSSAPTEASLTDTNLAELFAGAMRTWIVDDSATYVTSEQPTPDGGKKFKSENGAVLIVEPVSGQLKMSVVHKSVFTGQKRRSKLAREKAAEEVASWLRSTPASERPHKIIVTRSRFRQTLHNMLVLDHPNIIIGQSDLNLPIPMLLRHSRLVELRIAATESKGWEFAMYDDWPQSLHFQPITCFNLVNLILRGYHVNVMRTRQILVPDLHVEVAASHFWPTYATRAEWEQISIRLQEMIIADAARRMNVSPKDFTEKEKEGILLGKRMTNVEIQQAEMKEIESMRRTKLGEATTVSVVTATGEVVERRVRRQFDFAGEEGEAAAASSSASSWRHRALVDAAVLNERTAVVVDTAGGLTTASSDQLIFPESLIQKLLSCCDVQTQCRAYLFGHALPHAPHIKEVMCVMLPPQSSSARVTRTPDRIPYDAAALRESGLSFLGMLRVGEAEPHIHTHDVALQVQLRRTHAAMPVAGEAVVVMQTTTTTTMGGGRAETAGVTMRCFSLTPAALEWGGGGDEKDEEAGVDGGGGRGGCRAALKKSPAEADVSHYRPSRAMLSREAQGFFLVPVERMWNYLFRGALWNEHSTFDVVVDEPLHFFDAAHRPEHFYNFLRLGGEREEAVDAMDEADLFDDEGGVVTSSTRVAA